MIKKLILGAIGAGIVVAGYFGFYLPSRDINVGVDLPEAPALFETSLAAPISSTATTIPLSSIIVRGGEQLANYNCFTIDEGSSQAEFVCGTISTSTTSLINAARGVSAKDGFTENAALQFAHRRGASVKITDFPIIQILRNQNNGEATFENALRYAGSVVPSSADELADVGYVLSVVNGGTVNFDALVVSGTAGETLSTSTLVYFATTTQRWFKVDTDDTNTFQNVAVGLTRGQGAIAGSIGGGGVLLKGLQTGLSALTAGGTYYASSSAGTFSTATSVLPIGQAKSTTELQFDPVMFDVPRLGFDNTFTGFNTFTGGVSGVINVETYLASSTYTKPDGLQRVFVQAWGAGGSGGATETNAGDTGGGGGGAYVEAWFDADDLTATTSIVIGSGGAAVTDENDGNAGGNTTFGSLLTAYGGGGGGSDTSSGASGGGGGCFFSAGGNATGPTAAVAGTPGFPLCGAGIAGTLAGVSTSSVYSGAGGQGNTTTATGVVGGSSFYGGAGGGGASTNSAAAGGTSVHGGNGGAGLSAASGNATSGSVPGGGGGAKWSNGGTGNSGAGGNGMVIITEFY